MTGQKETVKEFEGYGSFISVSLSDDGKEIVLWSADEGSEMQATVWLDKTKAVALANHILELSRKIK